MVGGETDLKMSSQGLDKTLHSLLYLSLAQCDFFFSTFILSVQVLYSDSKPFSFNPKLLVSRTVKLLQSVLAVFVSLVRITCGLHEPVSRIVIRM